MLQYVGDGGGAGGRLDLRRERQREGCSVGPWYAMAATSVKDDSTS